jgi:DNA polymerase elongation subunit (family B)
MSLNFENYAILDIETSPYSMEILNEKGILDLFEKQQMKNGAMSPFLSHLVDVGVKVHGEKTMFFKIDKSNIIGSEKEILKEFWNYLKELKIDFLITYNGLKFDIPYIMAKTIVHDILPEKIIEQYKPDRARNFKSLLYHIDCFQMLFNADSPVWLNLYSTASSMGIQVKDEKISGAMVPILFYKGEIEEIIKHNEMDIEVLEKIYQKMIPFLNKQSEMYNYEVASDKQLVLIRQYKDKLTVEEQTKLDNNDITKEEASKILDRVLPKKY